MAGDNFNKTFGLGQCPVHFNLIIISEHQSSMGIFQRGRPVDKLGLEEKLLGHGGILGVSVNVK